MTPDGKVNAAPNTFSPPSSRQHGIQPMLPRIGILALHPIQYYVPLYQRLASRGVMDLDVLYLSDLGHRPEVDSEFGVPIAWNIDLLSGYTHNFISNIASPGTKLGRLQKLRHWISSHDAVITQGYDNAWMLLTIAICRSRGIPYILRCASHAEGRSGGIRRSLRNAVVRTVVSGSAACLTVGQLNEQFCQRYGARNITFAPNSVDDERFARAPECGRREVLARWGLPDSRKVVIFCGKLCRRKRPLDLAAAIRLLPCEVTVLFVGDGPLADQVRASLAPGQGAVTGFINQEEIPSYYHAADVLVLPSEAETWGLVVNEAMAAGALPVVSDQVGAAPDLVCGLGEIYACGDVPALAGALSRALARVADPRTRDMVRQHAAHHSLDRTVAGFEKAVLTVTKIPGNNSPLDVFPHAGQSRRGREPEEI